MFRWQAHVERPRIDLTKYKRELQIRLREALAQGAFEWLNASLARIPVWSGASVATFLHLTRELGYPLNPTPRASAPNRVSLGQRKSGGEFKTDTVGQVSFSYETTLDHLIYNEYTNANQVPDPTLYSRLLRPGPYNFQAAGAAAFLKEVRDITLPDPRQFTKKSVRKVS